MKRLWRKLTGPRQRPTLVIPVPEIGPSEEQLSQLAPVDLVKVQEEAEQEASDRHFLFGAPEDRHGHLIMRLPLDPVVAGALYQGIRPPREGEVRSSVSYDPERASEQLARLALDPGTRVTPVPSTRSHAGISVAHLFPGGQKGTDDSN